MKKAVFAVAALTCAMTLSAQVKEVTSPVVMDGKLDDGAWKSAPLQSGFTHLSRAGKSAPDAQTEFKILADKENLYVGILCKEPQMKKVNTSPSGPMWGPDAVELFLLPSGQPDEFYQFAVTAGNNRYSMFYGESGAIRPDSYLPFWESKVFYGPDFWSAELKIPFSALYMTRGEKWKPEWLFNVSRSRTPVSETTSWSPLKNGFHETANFNKVKGFPARNPSEDIFIKNFVPDIQSYKDGVYRGTAALSVLASAGAAGEYSLTCEEPGGKSLTEKITLKSGLNSVALSKVEFLKKTPGKVPLKLTLTSEKTGVSVGRYYPVDIQYHPASLVFSRPSYRATFYPGQNANLVQGTLKLKLTPEQRKNAVVTLSIQGAGVKEQTKTFKATSDVLDFSFDTKGFKTGEKAVVKAKVVCGKETVSEISNSISRPSPTKTDMVWIEDGALVRNGKPYYPRNIYALYYMGGTAFQKRYDADSLETTPLKKHTLEPGRLIRGIEAKEATKDVKPCPEIFEKVRQVVESNRDKDFQFYYISDEPECRSISPVYLKYIYDYVKELDPFHPVMTCSRAADQYIECADVFSVHPYISPIESGGQRILSTPIHQVRDFLRDVTKFHRPDKVPGFTGQFFSYKFGNINADYPTWDELESMSWSAIANGSRVHYPYAYHDLGDRPQIYEGYRYFNTSIKALEKQLLSNRKYEVEADDLENKIDTLLVEGDGVTLLIVVNLKNAPLSTTVSADHLKKFKQLYEFRSDKVWKVEDGKIAFVLRPYQSVVLTSKKMDAGLKPRDRIVKEVLAADKARGERGNLLFEKGATFEVDSSNPGGFGGTLSQRNKLFDGTLDMLGWQSNKWHKEHWYELNFQKRPPAFSRIAVYGQNVQGASVRIWKFGEWKILTPQKVEKKENSVLLDFGEPNKSVKVRIDFNGLQPGKDFVELYEIEFLK